MQLSMLPPPNTVMFGNKGRATQYAAASGYSISFELKTMGDDEAPVEGREEVPSSADDSPWGDHGSTSDNQTGDNSAGKQNRLCRRKYESTDANSPSNDPLQIKTSSETLESSSARSALTMLPANNAVAD
jgi:hypothetical protein